MSSGWFDCTEPSLYFILRTVSMKQSTIPFPLASLMPRLRVVSYRSRNNKLMAYLCSVKEWFDVLEHLEPPPVFDGL